MTHSKRLYRSKERIIAGVCGGIAEYFGIDPVIVRILWLILTFIGGSGILVYAILWFVIPSKRTKGEIKYKRFYRSSEDYVIAGVCGGIGEYFSISRNRIRIIWLLCTLLGGSGGFLYLVLWFITLKKKVVPTRR